MKADGSQNLRRTWHPECVKLYFIATTSKGQREALWARDRGVCAVCGRDTLAEAKATINAEMYRYLERNQLNGHRWQADHKLALINADCDPRAFTLDNLQTLCTACHKQKTKRDMAERKTKAGSA